MAIKKGKVIVVTSVKGGTGKTSTIINLALAMNKSVLLLDMDLSGRALATSLNLTMRSDIFELINDLETKRFSSLDNYVTDYQEKIAVIGAPNDPRKAVKLNNQLLNLMLSTLQSRYDFILIDTNHSISETNLILADLADEILFVTTPTLIDLKNLKTMLNIYKNIGKDNYHIVLNLATTKTPSHYDNSEIRAIIGANIDYTIPKKLYNKNYEDDLVNGKSKKNAAYEKIVKMIEGEE